MAGMRDLFPDEAKYRDEGCELFPSCLSCPFPTCRYDEPRGRQRWEKEARNREIIRAYQEEGESIKELARSFGISKRTVYRIIASTTCHSKGAKRPKNLARVTVKESGDEV